ncbi:MAG: HEAT repeat domain-containing protein, partial [Planctomycetota bacterium]
EEVFRAWAAGPAAPLESAFAAGGPEAESFLLRKLADGRHVERVRALVLLGSCGGSRSLAAVDRAAREPALRRTAVRSLGAIGRRDAFAVSVLFGRATEPGLRRAVIGALGETGCVEAVGPLLALATDCDTSRAAARALGRIAAPEAVRALLDLAARPGCAREVRAALGRFEPALVRAVLTEVASDRARRRALGALLRIRESTQRGVRSEA